MKADADVTRWVAWVGASNELPPATNTILYKAGCRPHQDHFLCHQNSPECEPYRIRQPEIPFRQAYRSMSKLELSYLLTQEFCHCT